MSRGTILVLDDHAENQKLVLHFLRAKGYAVSGVANTREADESLASNPADLVLVDVALPREDGLHWVERTRGRPGAPLHFVALTAHANAEVQERARAAGCTGYLTKPVPLKALLATVEACLSGREDPA